MEQLHESGNMHRNPRYAFIKIRSKHTIIDQIIRILKHTFPEYELEIIDVKNILKKNYRIVLINLFHMLRIYGLKTLFEEKNVIYNRFFGTPYMYHQIRRLLNDYSRIGYLFTIQDCSLFNGKLENIPHFVYTDHTVLANKKYPHYDPRVDLLSESWISLERDIYRYSDMVFTRSLAIRESVIQDYSCDPDNVQCIYYAPFSENRTCDSNIGKYSSRNILFVGLEWERKGGPVLLDAFSRVLCEVPDARLIIIGCTPRVTSPNVEIVGPVAQEKVRTYYETSAVFCLPTRREPFGIVFIEAMSHCLPVIGTKIGALPEFIMDGENGYLIDVDDTERLANLLKQLLFNPDECMRMGQHGYQIYRQKFTLEVVSSLLHKYISPYIPMS